MGALRSAPFIANSLGVDLGASLSFSGLDVFGSHIAAGIGGLLGGLSKGTLLAKSFSAWMGSVDKTLAEAEEVTSLNKNDKLINDIKEYMGPGMKVIKPEKGSDLILRSADGTKQIRFDITDSHGLEPHVNIETYIPRNAYPGDTRMIQTENLHVFPKNNLVDQELYSKGLTLNL